MGADLPYRELPELKQGPSEPTYWAAWARYRRLRALSTPLIPLVAYVSAPVIQEHFGGNAFAGGIAMMWLVVGVGFSVACRRLVLAFRCPRCDFRFQPANTNESDRCAHCQLRRFALFDDRKNGATRE